MKNTIPILFTLLALIIFADVTIAADEQPNSAQGLYLQAGKLERQGNRQQAQEAYELLIERFPDSELAVKANDRLLQLVAPVTPAAQQPAPVTARTLPTISNLKGRGLALYDLKRRAAKIFGDEKQSQFYAYTTKYGHRFNRGELRDKEEEWEKNAEEKVRKELGMGTSEIGLALEEVCSKMDQNGPCTEDQFK